MNSGISISLLLLLFTKSNLDFSLEINNLLFILLLYELFGASIDPLLKLEVKPLLVENDVSNSFIFIILIESFLVFIKVSFSFFFSSF